VVRRVIFRNGSLIKKIRRKQFQIKWRRKCVSCCNNCCKCVGFRKGFLFLVVCNFPSLLSRKRVLFQCYVFGPRGSGSVSQTFGSGSVSQRFGSGSRSFYHQEKIVKKTLIPTVLWLLYDLLSLRNDVNLPSKSNKQKTRKTKINYLTKDSCYF
jgi:hypothetical protein